jgi:hypothetical protein
MNMKRLLLLVAFFATLQASAQQVNPVPDYVFANRMSAGRNTVTDTAAYFSIGPRYGATRGMMPPMVVDTASFSGNKRNGLLIFSVQKNKFLYWDSVGVKWAEMSGTGGSAITGSGVAGYMPEFTTTTNLDTTRLYHSAGRFAIGSTTTTNGVLNVYGAGSYFDTLVKIGKGDILVGGSYNPFAAINNSSIVLNGSLGGFLSFTNGVRSKSYIYSDTTDMYIRTVSAGRLLFGTRDSTRMFITTDGKISIAGSGASFASTARLNITDNSGDLIRVETSGGSQRLYIGQDTLMLNTSASGVIRLSRNYSSAAFINSSSEFLINTETDAGDYKLQVSGNIYSTSTAVFAATSGSVGIGTTSPVYAKLQLLTSGSGIVHQRAAGDYFYGTGFNGNNAFLTYYTSSNFIFGYGSSTGGAPSVNTMTLTTGGSVGIGTTSPNASALFDVTSTTKGFLPPRMTTTERNAIASPAAGLVIYNTTDSKLQVYTTAWTDLH